MSKRRVLCKFFVHGACLKGENCEFSHDWNDSANNICTFYQKGACSYGSRCRYEHVKVSRLQPPVSASSASSSACPGQHLVSRPIPVPDPSKIALGVASSSLGVSEEVSALKRPLISPSKPVWSEIPVHNEVFDESEMGEPMSQNPADRSICPFAAAGSCPRGEECLYLHGDLCVICGKQCLHPFRPQEREEHIKSCEKRQMHLEALKHSREIECSVCLERVLLKSTPSERKFGILSECDHPFCVSCIRNWRNSSPASGMDVNSTLRACPICRKLSYFIIPSVIWYSTKEEKQEIVDTYKAKLRSIDCKHFDFGNASCPFGTSCFYKHTVKPGSYMWHASGSSFQDLDELEHSSDVWDMDGLRLMIEDLFTPQSPIGLEELEIVNNDDLENEVAEALAFLSILESSDASDEDNYVA